MAPQTHKNLQCCALGIIAVALNFDFPGDCWKSGHCRMTELPVEEWFGRLRSRSSTSQLSARAFWRSAAKEMLRYVKEGKVQPSSRSGGSSPKAVSPEEFFDMSKRALDSAIKLVAFCSNVSEESLRSLYLESEGYNLSAADLNGELHEWEQDPKAFWEEFGEQSADADDRQCQDLLEMVRQNAQDECADEETESARQEPQQTDHDASNLQGHLAPELQGLPDSDKLREVFEARGEPASPFRAEDAVMQSTMDADYGCTLHRTLSLCPGMLTLDDDGGAVFDALWRLCMYLRHYKQGGDKHWLKNPRAARRSARATSWYK